MNKEIVAKYLSSLKKNTGLTYDAIAKKVDKSESTVKNLCLGTVEDPRVDTVAMIVYALGGSMDEMLNPKESKDELKETSILALKDIYEDQLSTLKETHKEEIQSIRAHYEQHHQDLVDNFERRLSDKREIIDIQKKENIASKIVAWSLGIILIGLLIAEVMNPNLGWFRY